MVQATVKREKDADRITGGKDYPVVGFMGGCVIIVDDKNQFMSLSFANVADEWTVSTDAAEKAEAPAAPAAPAAAAPEAPEVPAQAQP